MRFWRLFPIMLFVAVLMAATFAIADEFAINSGGGQAGQEDISAGSEDVDACNSNVEVNIDGGWDHDVYEVKKVYVNADDLLPPDGCEGATVKVTLTDADGHSLAEKTGTLDALGDAILGFGGKDIPVTDVKDVHVLIDQFTGPTA